MSEATVRLRDVVEINPSSRLSDTSLKEVCFVAMADVSETGRIINFQTRLLHEVNKGYTSFCQGDVLLAKITPCFENGKAAVVEHLASSVGFGSTEFHILRPSSEIDARFLFHLIWNPRFRRLGATRMTGSAGQKRVPTAFLAEYEFRLPKLAEQKRIAAILDKADSLRRKRQEAIRLADEFLRAVFIDLFGTLDSQTHAQVSFGDIADLDAPMVDPTSDEYADMLHVGPDRIEKGNGQLLACETARAEGLISKKFIFDEGYVLYSKIRPALKKCALAEFRGLCSADMYPVRPVEGQVTREFIWGLLLSDAFDRYIDTLPDRANIPKLNRTELNSFQFRLPPIKLQKKYSDIVSSTMKLKRRYQNFLAEADSLPASFQFFI
jgi:type I restriction enzyme S subunit